MALPLPYQGALTSPRPTLSESRYGIAIVEALKLVNHPGGSKRDSLPHRLSRPQRRDPGYVRRCHARSTHDAKPTTALGRPDLHTRGTLLHQCSRTERLNSHFDSGRGSVPAPRRQGSPPPPRADYRDSVLGPTSRPLSFPLAATTTAPFTYP